MRFFSIRERFSPIFERKKTLIFLTVLLLLGVILGMIFVKTPVFYDYHLKLLEQFVERVCFSSRSVFLIFLERLAGSTLLLVLVSFSGVHTVALLLPPVVLFYRSYTFGATVLLFFSVYRLSGALVLFFFYLPVHLLVDLLLTGGATLAFVRARTFCWKKDDFSRLFLDIISLFILLFIVCLLELLLLLVFFRPMGNIF